MFEIFLAKAGDELIDKMTDGHCIPRATSMANKNLAKAIVVQSKNQFINELTYMTLPSRLSSIKYNHLFPSLDVFLLPLCTLISLWSRSLHNAVGMDWSLLSTEEIRVTDL